MFPLETTTPTSFKKINFLSREMIKPCIDFRKEHIIMGARSRLHSGIMYDGDPIKHQLFSESIDILQCLLIYPLFVYNQTTISSWIICLI